jgi:uncharacterized protein (TIGR02271 family)
MIDRTRIREGAVVYGADGEKLGKVRACDTNGFVIEKGLFFPKDILARYDDVADVDDDGIRMVYSKDAFSSQSEGREDEPRHGLKERLEEDEDVRVPIAEERLDVSKHDRQAGEVRLRKDVETEHRTIDVPVVKERVHVERIPGERRATPDEGDFRQTTASMPVREEEVEIHKRPVVKEVVRLRKEREIEHRAAGADVRKERASIEREDSEEPPTGTRDPDEDER